MITTVTLNPCMDRTITVEEFLYGGTNKVLGVRNDIAGKGINVSKAVKNLGEGTLALGFCYQEGKEKLHEALDAWEISHDLVEAPGVMRTNVKIFDDSKKIMSEFNDKGCPVSPETVERFMETVEAHLPETDILVLDGSVPQGVPADIYRILIRRAKEKGIKTILDASGELLLEGIKAGPDLIKPNLDELSLALHREFHSRDEIVEAARELVGSGVGCVCVSLGAEGALLVDEKDVFYAPALPISVKGVQGAGDSMVAGFCLAMRRMADAEHDAEYFLPPTDHRGTGEEEISVSKEGKDMAEMLRYAMAAAAGSLILEGTGLCEREDFERFLPQVTVEKIDEFFDIRTSDGMLTGRVKARSRVHREGDWHGTAHMWVVNRGEDGRWKFLIQRRSMDKDNYPGYCDISSAGHLSAGDTFEEAAYRELYEELGLRAEQGDLTFAFFMGRQVKEFFHGHPVVDREISAIYYYDKPLDLTKLKLQKEEVEEVFWMDFEELEQVIEKPEAKFCVYGGEIRKLKSCLDAAAREE